jgi:hypothetical protein
MLVETEAMIVQRLASGINRERIFESNDNLSLGVICREKRVGKTQSEQTYQHCSSSAELKLHYLSSSQFRRARANRSTLRAWHEGPLATLISEGIQLPSSGHCIVVRCKTTNRASREQTSKVKMKEQEK